MEINTVEVENVLIIRITAPALDAGVVEDLRSRFNSLINDRSKVVVELSGVDFIDSSGLGVLLSGMRLTNTNGGSMHLANMKKPVRKMFEMCKMDQIFKIVDSEEEAIKLFN